MLGIVRIIVQASCSSEMTANKSLDTDPQQQEAASPRMLVVRSFLR